MITKEFQAIFFILLSYIMFACLNCCIKIVATELDPIIALGYRNLFICIPLLCYMVLYKRKIELPKLNKFNVFKGLVEFISIPLWAIAIVHLKIGEAVAISYITPIISIMLAVFFLREKLTQEKIIAICIGFIGAYIILMPTSGVFNFYSLFILGSSILWAIGNVATKHLTSKQAPYIIVLYTNIVSLILVAPLFLPIMANVNSEQILILALLAIFANAANLCVARAYTLTEMTNLLPLDYTRLIFSTILGYTIFGEIVGVNTYVGTAIILSASFYLVRKIKKKSQPQKSF